MTAGTDERTRLIEPWFVRKTFAMFADHHHDDRLAFWCAAPAGAQEELVASDPERFFRPPYVGGRGWIGVWLDGAGAGDDAFWDEIAEIVADAYREVAPKKPAQRGTTSPPPCTTPVGP